MAKTSNCLHSYRYRKSKRYRCTAPTQNQQTFNDQLSVKRPELD